MVFDKEFIAAISNLPSAEKDKLLLRLLKKDILLANRLHFELVSNLTVNDRRAEMIERVKSEIDRFHSHFYSPGYLHVDLRYLSGEINEHVSITKDKIGEIELHILLVAQILEKTNQILANETPGRTRKLYIYLISKVFKIFLMMQKQHEDVQYDFKESIEQLGQKIIDNTTLMKAAIYNGLDVNWLINFEIPNDIHLIQKDLRMRGYL